MSEEDYSFCLKSGAWDMRAELSGCVEFYGGNIESDQYLHVCEIEAFLRAVTEVRDEMKRRDYEI